MNPAKQPIVKVIFFEYQNEIARLHANEEKLDQIYVAVGAGAQAACLENKQEYVNTVDFINGDQHKQIIHKSSAILAQLLPAFTLVDDEGVSKTYSRTMGFYLRFYIHYIVTSLLVIEGSISKFKPLKSLFHFRRG